MPVTVFSLEDSPKITAATGGEGSSVELHYAVRGTGDDSLALTMIQATAPTVYADAAVGTLVRQSISSEYRGGLLFDCRVKYGPRAKPETGQYRLQFETAGGTQKITRAFQEVHVYVPAGAQAPSFHGAIGVTDSGVEGCEVVVPIFTFSEMHYVAIAQVTQAYVKKVRDLTGTVNNAAFRGFEAGEVLFLGASGSLNNPDNWEVTYKFSARKNMTGLTVDDITGIAKKGWEYLWCRYETTKDPNAKIFTAKTTAAVVDRIYDYSDFAELGIGNS
jgi:hypothetical protein